MILVILSTFALAVIAQDASTKELWCYACSSAQSGCGPPIDVRLMHWRLCIGAPVHEQMCVKMIEKVNDQVIVTRGCLSDLLLTSQVRLDMPKVRRHGYCLYSVSNQQYLQSHLKGEALQLWSMGSIRPETENYKMFCFCNDWSGCNTTTKVYHTPFLTLLMIFYYTFLT